MPSFSRVKWSRNSSWLNLPVDEEEHGPSKLWKTLSQALSATSGGQQSSLMLLYYVVLCVVCCAVCFVFCVLCVVCCVVLCYVVLCCVMLFYVVLCCVCCVMLCCVVLYYIILCVMYYVMLYVIYNWIIKYSTPVYHITLSVERSATVSRFMLSPAKIKALNCINLTLRGWHQ